MSASDAASSGQAGLSPATIAVALTLLLSLQPVATDVYLPALPQLPAALGVPAGAVQWTLSVVILTFGAAQLLWGPVSDRVGRRPVMLCGVTLFVLASAITVIADSLGVLLAARAGQGLGVAGAVVCGRAMIRDLFAPEAGARVLSKALSGLGLIALVGPLLGAAAAAWLGWRGAFALIGLFGAATLWFVATRLRETLPPSRRQGAQPWSRRLGQWAAITRHPMFRAYTALTSATFCGLYAYLAVSSFVFIEVLQVPRAVYGLAMASISLCYLAGTVLCRRRLAAHGLTGTVRLGAAFSLAGGLACGSLSAWSAASGVLPPAWSLLPGLWLYGVGHGFHQPCSQAGVVAAFPEHAGMASALAGFVMSALAFGTAAVLSEVTGWPALQGTIHPMTLGLAASGAVTAWVALGRVQRDGNPATLLAAP